MKKPIALSGEERMMLAKLNNEQLRILAEFKDTKAFVTFAELISNMIDIDKNIFFARNEAKTDPVALACEHAYVRGAAARGVMIQRLILGSQSELKRRHDEIEKQKSEVN